MIIDATLFNDEFSMLEFRMKYLWDCVDKFVVVEGDKTFSGKPKPPNFAAAKKRFEWAEEKIIYFPATLSDSDDPWKIEAEQRNTILDACAAFPGNAILMLGDVDEIPSRLAVEFRKANSLIYPMTCEQFIIPYNLTYACDKIAWRGTMMTDLDYVRQAGAQKLRGMRERCSPFPQGGWHLSYFGGAEQIKHKIESFSHQELNRPEFTGLDHIRRCIDTGGSLFNEKSPPSLARVGRDFYPPEFVSFAPPEWWA